ncbi:MAG: dihydrodipicolinate synthase family protein [Clostridia bacterium]
MAHFALKDIRGVIPAMLTPFAPDESMDLERVRALVKHLCQKKIGGLYLTGSTGEGFMMTLEERKAVVETVIDEAKGKTPIIVHVGAISTMHSAELARHAAACGADAISSVPPIYWKFTDDGIAGYYADLVQAAGIPMIVYNIALAGLVSFEMIKRLGAIDGVGGIKYTSATHFDMFRIKEALGDDFMIYSGSDEMAISGLAFGSDGIIGSTYNCIADLFIQLEQSMQKGDVKQASALQHMANQIIFTLLKYDLLPVLKLALGWEGVDVGVCRKPFTRFTAEQESAMKAEFAALQAKLHTEVPFMKAL